MVFKRNTLLLILRLVVILGVMMCIPLVTALIDPDQLLFTFLVIGLVLVLLIVELVFFLNRTNRELTGFLENIRNRDFSIRFNEAGTRGAKKKLYRIFNEVLQIYQDIRIEKEVQFRFLDQIIELAEVGIMVLDKDSRIVLMNTAAGNLIGISNPETWGQVQKKNPDFASAVDKIKGSGRQLFESGAGGFRIRLAIQASRTTMLEEPYLMITLQDVRSVVEEKETGAWIRLMRTLNHEIKNSVTPITSLADTILMILKHSDGNSKTLDEIDPGNLSDVLSSAETLHQRSKSLQNFIGEYQKLTRIPPPDPSDITVIPLLRETVSLFEGDLEKLDIGMSIEEADPDLKINADRGLIQQVLINLVKNSMEALTGSPDPEILLGCSESEEGVTLSVKDNGEGIEREILDDVFVPFYSTKKEGSGIGLSLTRQVMRLHGGDVRIASGKGEGTIVYLDFLRQAGLVM